MLNNSVKKIFFFIKLPLIIHWLTILTLTTLPAESLPSVGFSDKIQHFLAFFVLGFLLYFNLIFQSKYKSLKKSPFYYSILISVVYALFDELHQLLVPNRSAEIMDFVADVSGSLVGTYIALIFFNYFKEIIINFLKIKLEPLSEKKVK